MQRRRILLLLGLAAVAVVLVLCWPRGPQEPVYEGKRLTEWMENIGSLNAPEADRAARQALRAIGSNAVPWLLDQFDRRDSPLRVVLNALYDGPPRSTPRYEMQTHREQLVVTALSQLGPGAATALPGLAARLDDSPRRNAAAWAMSACGTNALPFLLRALASTNLQVAGASVTGLGHLAREEVSAVPPLLQALQHSQARVRWGAAFQLGRTNLRPDLVTPALAQALSDGDAIVHLQAGEGLRRLSSNAQPALPVLLRLMTNSVSRVAVAASNAVFRIDPAALPPRGR